MKRWLEDSIYKDLAKKMVFLVGPRQVGKTWLAKEIGKRYKAPLYLNYDAFEDRQVIEKVNWSDDVDLLIFDEIHKMPRWKNHLKGIFDTRQNNQHILVTGSARLDTFRQAGDSLAGRFFKHRLMPFTLAELSITKQTKFSLGHLIKRGGFPEPTLASIDQDADRWRQQYTDGLIRDEVIDFESIQDLRALKTILELLRRNAGSQVSYQSISRDVGVSPNTVIKYVEILEALFIIFRIRPYSKNIARSILREPKIYFFDTGMVIGDEGAKFENFTAVSLIKHVYARNDQFGEDWDLQYIRTKDKREVDFCLVKDKAMHSLIEVKISDSNLHKNLLYFSEMNNVTGYHVVKKLRHEQQYEKVKIVKADKFLTGLYL